MSVGGRLLRWGVLGGGGRKIHTWRRFTRWQDIDKDRLKFEKYDEMSKIYLDDKMYITVEDPGAMIDTPYEDRTREEVGCIKFDSYADITMCRYIDHSYEAITRFVRLNDLFVAQYDQRFLPERHLTLGPDLAAAHFIVARGGAVKFVGERTWYRMEKGQYGLPGKRVAGLYLEAIDAANTDIMFEGLDNLIDLNQLRLLRLSSCKHMTDWCLSKMHQFAHSLEYLDLSDCRRISSKGLAGLACLKKLKCLRLEGFDEVKDVAKVSLMLEDSIEGLEVVGVDYEHAAESLHQHKRLLSHERVYQDGRNNLFLYDDHGEAYYVGGNVTERPVVDDDDLPLFVNKVRKDPPKVSLAEMEEVDLLSEGKLRHSLVGSPSGIHRDEETQRILLFEEKKKLKHNASIHPFLLPSQPKHPQLTASDESVDKPLLNQ